MKYVDAEYIKAVMINDRLMQGNAEFNLYAQQVEIQVNAMPSIDIVRCKECYMCDEEMWCSFYDSIMEPDDFCSYGERDKDTNVPNKWQTERSE